MEALREHFEEKILYHKKLIKKYEAQEDYLQCAYHRDQILELRKMQNTDIDIE